MKDGKSIFSSIEGQLTSASNGAEPVTLWTLTEERLSAEVEGGPSIWKDLEQHLRLIKARPKLRSDLVISRVEEAGVPYVVIKDPVALKYFRFKENDYFVLTLLDGDHEVRDIVHQYSQKYRPIRPEAVQRFLDRVESFDLLEKGRENIYTRLIARLFSRWTSRLASLLRLDYTLPDTDGFTQRLYRKVHFVFSTPMAWVWGLFALSGLAFILLSWRRFGADLKAVLASGWGLAAYVLLVYLGMAIVITIHELAHALTCVHFGGHVHKMGVMFYYLSLTAYADTSDAWLFPSRWHRAWVSLAGPLSTLCFGALATWVWRLAPADSVLSRLSVMLVLSTMPLSFSNLNPFMEYDGYYVLSDITGIANLRHCSFEYCRQWLHHLLRRDEPLPTVDAYRRRIFLGYGSLAAVYFVVLVILPLAWQIPYLLRRFGPVVGGVLVAVILVLFSQRHIRALYERWQEKRKMH